MIEAVEQSQMRQMAAVGSRVMGMLAIDESDAVYQSFRFKTTFGLEVAGMGSEESWYKLFTKMGSWSPMLPVPLRIPATADSRQKLIANNSQVHLGFFLSERLVGNLLTSAKE